MRSLAIISILLVLPFSLLGQKPSLFDTMFAEQEIGASLGHRFVEEGKWVIIYHSYSGLSAYAYKVMLEAEKSGYTIQLAYINEDETELRYYNAKKYNHVILDKLRKSINLDEKIEAPGFGCEGYPQNSFGIYSRYPLIEFEQDRLTLTEYSKCIIDEFYLPILSHSGYGDWELTIFSQMVKPEKQAIRDKREKYLLEYLTSKGINSISIKMEDYLYMHYIEDLPRIQDHLVGLDIERVK